MVILIFFLLFYDSTSYLHKYVLEIVHNNVAFSGIRYVFGVGTVNMDLHNKPVFFVCFPLLVEDLSPCQEV